MKEHNFAQGSREFYGKDHQMEDPAVVELHEMAAVDGIEQRAEFKDALSRIDFNAIKQLYADLARRTDIDPAKLNFAGPERVIERDLKGQATAMYGLDTNVIEVDYKFIESYSQKSGTDPAVALLDVIMHEEGHAAAKARCVGKLKPGKFSPTFIQSGFSQDVFSQSKDGESFSAFAMFEEGVTEKLSRELGKKYLDTHPDFADAKSVQRLREFYDNDYKAKSYDLSVSFVESFITRVAHETGVSEDLVWGAIIRGKLEGADLGDTDFAVLFDEMFDEKFLERLADVNSADEELRLVRLMGMDKLKEINPKLRARINKRIDAFSAYERKTRAA